MQKFCNLDHSYIQATVEQGDVKSMLDTLCNLDLPHHSSFNIQGTVEGLGVKTMLYTSEDEG